MSLSTDVGESPALAPVTAVPSRDIHAHTVQFYEHDASLCDELSRLIGSALGAGDVGIIFATPEHREGIETRLHARGLDVDLPAFRARYHAFDASETLALIMRDGQPDAERFTDLVGGIIADVKATTGCEQAHVVIFGELVALLCADGQHAAAIRLEELWNELAGSHTFALRCAYPMNVFGRPDDGEALWRICAEHGGVIPTESYTGLIDDDARLRTVASLQQKAEALTIEVEERKRVQASLSLREAELADVLENSLEGIQLVDADQRVVWANPALFGLLGFAPHEYVGQSLRQFHLDPVVFDTFWGRLMRREDIYDFPAALRCKDGSVRHVLLHANGLWDGDRFVRTRCFVRDVTEQTRMARELRQRNQELHAAVAARDEFLSIAAHELKTPITSLRAFAQLLLRDIRLQREVTPNRLSTALGAIESQTSKLNQLVARLLDLTQIEAGRLQVEPIDVDLVALVREAIAQQAGDTLHPIVYVGPEQLDAVVDPVRFEQAITNLLTNAIKFSPLGGVVTVELRQDRDGVKLAVTDRGVGIPHGEREQIFTRFHQAHRDRHLSGMGIGLSVTREIVELHGGSVHVEEPEHPGSRFVVSLPAMASGERMRIAD